MTAFEPLFGLSVRFRAKETERGFGFSNIGGVYCRELTGISENRKLRAFSGSEPEARSPRDGCRAIQWDARREGVRLGKRVFGVAADDRGGESPPSPKGGISIMFFSDLDRFKNFPRGRVAICTEPAICPACCAIAPKKETDEGESRPPHSSAFDISATLFTGAEPGKIPS